MDKSTASEWLTLQAASRHLGVNPATLRLWANQGKVSAIRTPGGHRRFNVGDMKSFQRDKPSRQSTRHMEMIVHGALGRAHLEFSDGRLANESWYREISAVARDAHRDLGRQLMALLLQAVQVNKESPDLNQRAHGLGRNYAQINLQQKISLPTALRAFLYFRDYIFEHLIELSTTQGEDSTLDSLTSYHRLNQLVNQVLIAMVDSYSAGK
ncbi:MAG: MerR family DNA-binding transcriptional regulator [Chloroflexi bacterium]|nr:MerR family DNA-binding transcriptional regulator [Chloroflexota bacterium]